MVNGADQGTDAASFHTEVPQILLRFRLAQIHQLALDLRADHDRLRREMVARVFLDGGHVWVRVVAGGGKIVFGNVAGEKGWLRAEQEKIARDLLFFGSEVE